MDNSEAIKNIECEMSQQPIHNNFQLEENVLSPNDIINPSNILSENSNSKNQTTVEINNVCSEKTNVISESGSVISTDISVPPLPPPSKDDKEQLIQSSYPADYNAQNYSNYNYMYNYNNYYGYPYPQYQWDYTSQQYYQPYQNYYNYNYNANQVQTSKPPPPPPDAVQLPVEEKPVNKTNMIIDDSNRYSPTVETDDDDTLKELSENNKSDVVIDNSMQITNSLTDSTIFKNMTPEQIEIQQNISESGKVHQSIVSTVLPVQQSLHPVISQTQSYNIPVQPPSFLNNSQIQSVETVKELPSQQQNSHSLNGKEDFVEKVSKGSTVLGKNQAKKRLMAFSMMKQKLQEQNNLTNDNQNSDIGEGNDVEFIPELNIFQTVSKKKVVTNKKVNKVIKAQQTIEQIEEMKKDELLQGNNAALYQHLLRSGGSEAPILQKLGIESLAEKYSAKIREQDERLKRHHHRRRDDNRRSHKHRRRSHSKSRSRSKTTEKPKMRALEVQSWKDFVDAGFHFNKFRRFKVDEAEEMKDKERKSRPKKRHSNSRPEGKKQNAESIVSTDVEKGNSDQKLRYNLLDRKKEILKGLEVITHDGDFTKEFPSYIIRHTKTKPVLKYSENPAKATCHLQNRQQMLSTLLPEIEVIVHKFLSSMKPKKIKENPVDVNYNYKDDKLLLMMKDLNIYPFKGWWPKTYFIVTQVKEDPNIEIDKDALRNELTISKRTKKSRFNDDTSLIDLRPTVPSKWDSDYDGSPATDKVVDIEVSQSLVMNTNDDHNIKENNSLNVSYQVESMDTTSGMGENEPNIEVNICPILPIQSDEPQGCAKLDTEYEEFLKIVSVDKIDEKDVFTTMVEKEHRNDISIKSGLYDESTESKQEESEEDTSTKSSDDSVSLHNVTEELVIDSPFVKHLTSMDLQQKNNNKKSKKFKKKEGKKKKRKFSSSESSQDSDSDSSSENSESEETTDSTSTIEKKQKNKKRDRNKNKKKNKYISSKNKIKKPEVKKDDSSSILNLLEKAFNVEIKKKLDSEEPKQKKRKRKHEKKESKSNEDNDDEFEKVKVCLKETFTKLVQADKIGKNQSLSCNNDTVSEVLKYLKIDEEMEKKHKKSKKGNKRKYDSDISDDGKTLKKSKLDDSIVLVNNEKKKKKKKKKSVDSEETVLKKKSKKKSKTTDTSETEDGEESKQNKIKKEKGSENFFGLRPNDWNMNNKSSMRGVVHHSDIKNNSDTNDFDKFYNNVKKEKSKYINFLNNEKSCSLDSRKNKIKLPNIIEKYRQKDLIKKKLEILDTNNDNDVSNSIIKGNINMNLINYSISNFDQEEKCNFENDKVLNTTCNQHGNNSNLLQATLTIKKENHDLDDPNDNLKPIQSESVNQYHNLFKSSLVKPLISDKGNISFRDKVKMNLKKLSTCQYPFGFGFTSFDLIEKNKNKVEETKHSIEVTSNFDDLNISVLDKPKVDICSQSQNNSITKLVSPKTDIETNNKMLTQSFNWEDSEESESDQSSVTSTNTSEYFSDVENDQSKNDDKDNYSFDKNEESLQNENEILSNDREVNELEQTFNLAETISSSDSKVKEQTFSSEVSNNFSEEHHELSNLSNSIYFNNSEHFMSNVTVSQDDTEIVEVKEQTFSSEVSNNFSEEHHELSNLSNSIYFNNPEHFMSNVTVSQNDTEIVEVKEQTFSSEVSNNFSEEHHELSNLSNSIYFNNAEHFMSNVTVSQNDTEVVLMKSPENKHSDIVCSQNSIIDLDVIQNDNELITQWKSDWNKLDRSVTKINNTINNQFGDFNKLEIKKKSRWNMQYQDNNIYELQGFINGHEELQNIMENYAYDELNETLEKPSLIYTNSVMSNNSNDSPSYDCHSETYSNEYVNYSQYCHSNTYSSEYIDYSQSYDYYSQIPIYSEMKTIEDDQLSPVDYSIYENYNPTFDFNDDDYDVYKSLNASPELTVGDTSSSLQVGDALEILHSEDISNVKNEVPNENIVTIIPNEQDDIVKDEKSDASCDEQFFKLYQQHFQHYNQNPIKYSLSDPVLDNISEVNISSPEKSPPQEKLYADQDHEKTVPIPLRKRGYSCIIEDNNTNIYLTSDNYVAYCAIEDRCMVHIAIDSSNCDGVEEEVRHCFNINQNGTIAEYWLHADLIPFHGPSDTESGVFSDEEDFVGSDSGQDDVINNDDDDNDNDNDDDDDDEDFDYDDNKNNEDIEGDYEIIDSNSETNDSWMKDPLVLNKYGGNNIGGVEQTVINQGNYMSSSSEYDSDKSDFSDAYVETCTNHKQNTTVNNSQTLSETEDKENESQYIEDVTMPIDVSQTENVSTNSDLFAENGNQLVLKIENETDNNSNENVDTILNYSQTSFETKTDEIKSQNITDVTSYVNVEQNGYVTTNSLLNIENDEMDQLVLNIKNEIDTDTLKNNADLVSVLNTENNYDITKPEEKENDGGDDEIDLISKKEMSVEELLKMNTIFNQQMLIQRLKIRAKEKIHKKQPDTAMLFYSDNMETIKHPFLGLFQPPTISILSKQRSIVIGASKLPKRVTFADGIYPGEDLAASPTHNDVGHPLSPPPLKALMRETLKLKRNMYPFRRSKIRTKLKMVNRKVAKVTPVIKNTTSSSIEYYISSHHSEDLTITETAKNSIIQSDDSPNSDVDHNRSEKITSPRPTRELTPVPSDTECWNDDDNITRDNKF